MTTASKIPETLDKIVAFCTAIGQADVTFSKSYLPIDKLEDLPTAALLAVVFPSSNSSELVDRNLAIITRIYQIVFTGKVDAGNMTTGLDGYITTVDEVRAELAKELRGQSDLLMPNDNLISVTVEPVYDFDKLANSATFQSLIALTTQTQTSLT
jgi:hypothetical protein